MYREVNMDRYNRRNKTFLEDILRIALFDNLKSLATLQWVASQTCGNQNWVKGTAKELDEQLRRELGRESNSKHPYQNMARRLRLGQTLNLVYRKSQRAKVLYINPLFYFKGDSQKEFLKAMNDYYIMTRPEWHGRLVPSDESVLHPDPNDNSLSQLVLKPSKELEEFYKYVHKPNPKDTEKEDEMGRKLGEEKARKRLLGDLGFVQRQLTTLQLIEWQLLNVNKKGEPYLRKIEGKSKYEVLVLPSV